MDADNNTVTPYYQYQTPFRWLVETSSNHVRKGIFAKLMQFANPPADWKILDVGVTQTQCADTNFFERLYPHPGSVTAVGLEDASHLERLYPGLKFVQADGLALPFADKSFDLAVSFAVVEHVGSRARQQTFINELNRVSKSFFVTTPNRWYPVEFHTVLPFVHWLPPKHFRKLLKLMGKDFFATEDTLNLLTEEEFLALMPPGRSVTKMNSRFLGPVSNLCLYVSDGPPVESRGGNGPS
jgi:hypothetical protein